MLSVKFLGVQQETEGAFNIYVYTFMKLFTRHVVLFWKNSSAIIALEWSNLVFTKHVQQHTGHS